MKALRILAAWCALCLCAGAGADDAVPNPDARARLVKVADGRLLAPDIARIVNRGEVVVAMVADDNPPFFSVKDGVLVGTDVDMAQRVARELGVRVRFDRSPASFDAVAEAVAAGRADLGISRLARTLRRGQYVHFSNTYMRLGHALLINRVRFAALAGDRPLQEVIRNFDGKLGVIANSSWEEFGRRNFPKAQLVRFKSWPEVVAAARSGAVVAAYRDELEVQQIVRNDPGLALSLRTVTFEDLESPLAMMVGIGDPTLLSFVNEVIAQWVDKPTVNSVLKAIK
ncbi:ABC transporter substrate-binding protein [uncultured Massilia sp.]|uniref:substrate-binding periplasmic protein n=1 Tax=uncultured Massilia sp. TaxID=169973 RepID=UPI0025F3B501|nr:ABC transporter substrate-binding protein [uncultured Massilia sp.]